MWVSWPATSLTLCFNSSYWLNSCLSPVLWLHCVCTVTFAIWFGTCKDYIFTQPGYCVVPNCPSCQIVFFYIAEPNCPGAKLSYVPNCPMGQLPLLPTRSLGALRAPTSRWRTCLTSSFTPFGRSGRVTHAEIWKALKNLVVLTPVVLR